MALSYADSAALMSDTNFRGRVKVASLSYANSIMLESATIASHNSRLRWASNCFQQPDTVAAQVQPPTVMDPAVQSAGSTIDDAGLQAAVQGVIDKMI